MAPPPVTHRKAPPAVLPGNPQQADGRTTPDDRVVPWRFADTPELLKDGDRRFLKMLTGHDYTHVIRGPFALLLVSEKTIDSLQEEVGANAFRFTASDPKTPDKVTEWRRFITGEEKRTRLHALLHSYERHAHISLIFGKETPDRIQWKRRAFESAFRRLTGDMQVIFRYCDFRTMPEGSSVRGFASSQGWGNQGIRLGSRSDLDFDDVFFHEVAHIKTDRIDRLEQILKSHKPDASRNQWEQLSENICTEETAHEEGISPFTARLQDGFITDYAYTSYREDVSDLTAYAYTRPGLVRVAADVSEIIRTKVQLLAEREYISPEQRDAILRPGAKEMFEQGWRKVLEEMRGAWSGGLYGDPHLEDIVNKTDVIWPESTLDPIEDAWAVMRSVQRYPCDWRGVIEKSPHAAKLITYLHDQQWISDREFQYLTSDKPAPDDIGRPACARSRCEEPSETFLEAAACYLSGPFRKK